MLLRLGLCGLALLFAVGLHLATLAPEITRGDAGEIATAVARLGVMHPTGYPLYTAAGHAVVRALPLAPHRALAGLNVLFGLGAALACILAVRALVLPGREPNGREDAEAARLGGALAALLLLTSPAVWTQLRIVEVYALHVLLVTTTWLFLARYECSRRPAALAGAAVAIGLGAAHHATTAILALCAGAYLLWRRPGLLVAWWPGRGEPGERRALWVGLVAAGVGVGSYALLPLAAARTDAIAWGDPTSLERLWAHVTALQYQSFLALEPGPLVRRASDFASWLWLNPSPIGMLLAGFGFVRLLRRAPAFAASSALYAGLSLLHGAAFSVGDFRNYWLPVLLVLVLWAGVGAAAGLARLGGAARTAVLAVCLAALAAQAWMRVDLVRAADPSAEPYVAGVVEVLEPGSVLLTARDPFVFPLWYAQYVQGRGVDLAFVNVFMLGQPWYRAHLERRHPGLLPRPWPEISVRAGRVPRYPPEEIAHRLVAAHIGQRPVYERNVFTYPFEGKVGRPWDGPAFDRPSADWALLNRGEVNQVVHFADVDGLDPCARDRLSRIALRPLEAGVAGRPSSPPVPAFRSSDRPRLLESSRLVADEAGLALELRWLERYSFDARRPDRRGRRLRHGVRVCVFDAQGRRVLSQDVVSGEGESARVALPAGSSRALTFQACSLGERATGSSSEVPCLVPILEWDAPDDPGAG